MERQKVRQRRVTAWSGVARGRNGRTRGRRRVLRSEEGTRRGGGRGREPPRVQTDKVLDKHLAHPHTPPLPMSSKAPGTGLACSSPGNTPLSPTCPELCHLAWVKWAPRPTQGCSVAPWDTRLHTRKPLHRHRRGWGWHRITVRARVHTGCEPTLTCAPAQQPHSLLIQRPGVEGLLGTGAWHRAQALRTNSL